MKALIIDDENDICYLLGSLLEQKRVSTDYVNTLQDAISAMKNNPPEVIFLDNHLPDGSGISFISYVKKFYPETKVVMITAYDTADDRDIAMKEGADYFIGKPFSRDKIYDTVSSLKY